MRSPGPYRQVSVGRRGICAITAHAGDSTANASGSDAAVSKSHNGAVRSREGDKLHCWGTADGMVHYSDQPSAAPDQWDQVSCAFLCVNPLCAVVEQRCCAKSRDTVVFRVYLCVCMDVLTPTLCNYVGHVRHLPLND